MAISAGRARHPTSKARFLSTAILIFSCVSCTTAIVFPSSHELYSFDYLSSNLKKTSSKLFQTQKIPLITTNSCPDTLWPGIATQNGEGPETQGFELAPGETRQLSVGPSWQGRVWGRTNCTVGDGTAKCMTGDCNGLLSCDFSATTPATLAEFNLAGGIHGRQTFYDISLVDGYNLPVGIVYHPAGNTSWIPPNLVNPTCIATAGYLGASNLTGDYYTNSSYPIPYETQITNQDLSSWCLWDLQVFPPEKPGDGIYPYPDDNIERPVFDPCRSACDADGRAEDCCTGPEHDQPSSCAPSRYSQTAKRICPDAYSYAFDDQTSTFIIPSGGGWEVVFCPEGRSTNILNTFRQQMDQINEDPRGMGAGARQAIMNAGSYDFIERQLSGGIVNTIAPSQSGVWWFVFGVGLVLVF